MADTFPPSRAAPKWRQNPAFFVWSTQGYGLRNGLAEQQPTKGRAHMNEKNSIQGTTSGTKDEGLVDQAKHVVENVVGNVAEQARAQVTTGVTAQKDKAVDTMSGVADALRQTRGGMKDAGPLPMLADQAADTVERVADYLQSKTLGDLVGEVERFARREPAIFLGGAFAIGLLGGRFLKSSAPTRTGEIDRFAYDRDYDRDEPARFAARPIAPALPALTPRTGTTTSTMGSMGSIGATGSTASIGSTGSTTGSTMGSSGSSGSSGNAGSTTTPMKAIPSTTLPNNGNRS
jgi:hypothetical protein